MDPTIRTLVIVILTPLAVVAVTFTIALVLAVMGALVKLIADLLRILSGNNE